MKRAVPEVVSLIDPDHIGLDDLARIASRAQAHLDIDPERAGARRLRDTIRYCTAAMEAIDAGKASAAAFAAMLAIHNAWRAEVDEGKAIIDAGIGTKRGGAKGGAGSAKKRSGPQSKRAKIEHLLAEYTGTDKAGIATVAKRAGATEAYVRMVIASAKQTR
jgi:hypothetical protein